MICEHCGHSMPNGSLTCERCGTYLGKYSSSGTYDSGVRAIRQGRVNASSPTLPNRQGEVREYGDYDLSSVPLGSDQDQRRKTNRPVYDKSGSSRPDTRRGVPVNAYGRAPSLNRKNTGPRRPHRRNVNWMLIILIVGVMVSAAAGGFWYFHSQSDTGQRSTARRNALSVTEGMFELAVTTDQMAQTERTALLEEWGKVNPQAYWLSGQEFMDMGDIAMAINCFRIGDVIDPENYDGLLLLANCYELDAQDEKAEQLYLYLTETVSSSRTEAYTALIRLYQAQGRRPEAADMMLTAYRNTDRESYRLEREDYIPQTPQISLRAGRYEISKLEGNVYLTSPQNYDIYYTVDDDAELPQDGVLLREGSFVPREGSVTLRAVCVSGDLVSDELSVNYSFYYPSPPAPKCNLAPNTYRKLRDVSLRPGTLANEKDLKKSEIAEMESHYIYHYTIDGSTPTENSPRFDGTPIKLPSGYVTLKAICINQYGKMSSILEVKYKFEVNPWPLTRYQEEDVFTGFVLNATTMADFKETFGQPREELEANYLGLANEARHLTYDWGYAVFLLENGAWKLVRVEMNRSIGNAPRGVGFGSTEAEITGVYQDCGQLPN
ncbi:MAG: chitobiase/beta-hexosaminidase C-terminal domain-containing protein, partial [Clostridia bacterium]|nr:chitobiase/beta-hexosaminidase C-terminal domain-containing protein [Clostridia bacterium]